MTKNYVELKKELIGMIVDAKAEDVRRYYALLKGGVVAENKTEYKAKSEPKAKSTPKAKTMPKVVKDFSKEAYVEWARYLGLYLEEYGKVRKADRKTVYKYMYGKVTVK